MTVFGAAPLFFSRHFIEGTIPERPLFFWVERWEVNIYMYILTFVQKKSYEKIVTCRHGIVATIVKRQISNEDKNCRDNFITTKKTKKTNSSICF